MTVGFSDWALMAYLPALTKALPLFVVTSLAHLELTRIPDSKLAVSCLLKGGAKEIYTYSYLSRSLAMVSSGAVVGTSP